MSIVNSNIFRTALKTINIQTTVKTLCFCNRLSKLLLDSLTSIPEAINPYPGVVHDRLYKHFDEKVAITLNARSA